MPFFEQRDRLIGPPRPARVRLGEKNRAEPVAHGKERIERRREIEQRIQQVEAALALWFWRSPPKCCSARIQ